MVTFEQFKQLDLRIARIVSCEDHPNADKLYILTVETGTERRKIVAGMRQYYSKDELPGKQIVIVSNLAPATIRGARSEGMLLAAKDDKRLALLVPEKEVSVGSPVS
ncbi:MAG: hypothetical protein A2Z72_05140 [Omnitrophica bacterium RBG_13_46_9]|nr:MAG: hypothetical protein A2Z72_05140 [Omnitrophica bacterium RBG_13_46_9]